MMSEVSKQHELYENARERTQQKKRLYLHFVIFLVGSVFLIVINKFLNVAEEYNWFVWAIMAWLFVIILHFIKVYITHSFMGKEWERKEIEKLVKKQEKKLEALENKIQTNDHTKTVDKENNN